MSLNINSNATLKATKMAQEKMLELAKERQKDKSLDTLPAIRVSVKPGGCSGFLHEIVFEEDIHIESTDEIIKFGEIRVVVDAESKEKLKGTTLQYIETLELSGFRFNNPNANRTCGCGNSFG